MSRLLPGILAMAIIVVASNILVQFLYGQWLTWGAFTYPFAFLVNDMTNRALGPQMARRAVFAGFALAVALSIYLATPRIAVASGAAFLTAQLLDVVIFDRLRGQAWWKAPALSSLTGSALDTVLFFSLAFAAAFVLLGPNDPFALESAPVFGVMTVDAPRWMSWALGDFCVKLLVAATALVPYRLLLNILPATRVSAA